MRQTRQIIPLLLIIALLCGALYLIRPGGPFDPGADDPIILDPPEQQPPADDPSDDDPPEQQPPADDPSDDDPPAVEPPVDEPDDPPVVDPPVIDPPVDEPDDPPVVDPPVVDPPVVDPPVVDPPIVNPPDVDPNYQYSCDVSLYMHAINAKYDRSDILLVNKNNPLGEYYVPSHLVYLNREDTLGGKAHQLDETAALALHAMMMCMRADGITDTFVTSAYRDYKYQVDTHNRYIQKERSGISHEAVAYFGYDYIQRFYLSQGITKLTLEDARSVVLSYSAPPGKSEHQSGLCVDFMTTGMSDLTNPGFEPTAAFRWLQENACQFGFILRYPEDKVNMTGYSYESWHYRFVGKEAAIEITKRGITLEEYLAVG